MPSTSNAVLAATKSTMCIRDCHSIRTCSRARRYLISRSQPGQTRFHGTRPLTEVSDQQTTTGAERRHISCQWHRGTVTDFTCWIALARCGRWGSGTSSALQSSHVFTTKCRSIWQTAVFQSRHHLSSATTSCTSLFADRTTPST